MMVTRQVMARKTEAENFDVETQDPMDKALDFDFDDVALDEILAKDLAVDTKVAPKESQKEQIQDGEAGVLGEDDALFDLEDLEQQIAQATEELSSQATQEGGASASVAEDVKEETPFNALLPDASKSEENSQVDASSEGEDARAMLLPADSASAVEGGRFADRVRRHVQEREEMRKTSGLLSQKEEKRTRDFSVPSASLSEKSKDVPQEEAQEKADDIFVHERGERVLRTATSTAGVDAVTTSSQHESAARLDKRKARSSLYWGTFILSILWVLAAGAVGINLVPEGIDIVEFFLSATGMLLLAGMVVPVMMFWGFAQLARRARELQDVVHQMTEAALRLLEPETESRERVASLGQSIRLEVEAMSDGIDRTMSRASELEALLQNEVSNLEQAYGENETRIRALIVELSNEREAVSIHADHVKTTITGAKDQLTREFNSIADHINATAESFTSALSETLNVRWNELVGEFNTANEGVAQQLSKKFIETVQSFDASRGRFFEELDTRFEQIDQHTEEASKAVAERLGSKMDDFVKIVHERTDEVEGRFNTLTGRLAQSGEKIMEAVDESVNSIELRSTEIDNRLRLTSDRVLNDFTAKFDHLDKVVVERGEKSLNAFGSQIGRLEERARQLPGSFDQIAEKAVDEFASHITKVEEQFSILSGRLAKSGSNIAESISRSLHEIEERSEDVDTRLSAASRRVLDEFEAQFGKVDAAIIERGDKSLDQFSEQLSKLEKHAGNLTSSFDVATNLAIQAFEKRLNQVDESLNERSTSLIRSFIARTEALEESTDKLNVALDVHVGRINEAFQQRTRDIAETLTGGRDGILSVVEETKVRLSHEMESVGTTIAQLVDERAGGFIDQFTQGREKLSNTLENETRRIVDTVGKQIGMLSQHVGDIENVLLSNIEAIDERARERVEDLSARTASFEEIVTRNFDTAREVIETQGKNLYVRGEALRDSLAINSEALSDVLEKQASVLEKRIARIRDYIAEGNVSFTDALAQHVLLVQNAANANDGALRTTFLEHLRKLEEQTGKLKSSFVENQDALLQSLDGRIDIFRDTLDKSKESIEVTLASHGKLVSDQAFEYQNNFVENLGQVQHALENSLSDAQASLIVRLSAAQESLVSNIANSQGGLVDNLARTEGNLVGVLGNTESRLTKVLTDKSDHLLGALASAQDKLVSALDRTEGRLSETLTDRGSHMIGTLIAAQDNLVSALEHTESRLSETLTDKGGSLADTLAAAQESLGGTLQAAQASLIDNIARCEASLVDNLVTVQENLGDNLQQAQQGLVEGVGRAENALVSHLGQAQNTLVDSLNVADSRLADTMTKADDKLSETLTTVDARLIRALTMVDEKLDHQGRLLDKRAINLRDAVDHNNTVLEKAFETQTAIIDERTATMQRAIEVGVTNVRSVLEQNAVSLSETLRERISEVSTVLTSESQQAETLITGAGLKLSETVMESVGDVDRRLSERALYLRDNMHEVGNQIDDGLNSIVKRIAGTASSLTDEAQKAETIISSAGLRLAGSVIKAAEDVEHQFIERDVLLKHNIQEIEGRITSGLDLIGERMAQSAGAFTQEAGKVESRINHSLDLINARVNEASAVLSDEVQKIEGQMAAGLDLITNRMSDVVHELGDEAKQAESLISSAGERLSGSVVRATQTVEEKLADRAVFLKENVNLIEERISSGLNSIEGRISDITQRTASHLVQRTESLQGLTETLQTAANKASDSLGALTDQFGEQLHDVIRAAEERLRSENNTFIRNFSSKAEETVAAVQNIKSDVSDSIAQLLDRLDTSNGTIQLTVNALRSSVNEVDERLGGVTNEFNQSIGQLADRFTSTSSTLNADLSRFGGLSQEALASVEKFSQQFEDHARILSDATNILDSSHGVFTEKLEERQGVLNQLASGLVEKSDEIAEVMQNCEQIISVIMKRTEESARMSTSQLQSSLSEMIGEAANRFEGATEEIRKSAEEIREELARTRADLSRGVRTLPSQTKEYTEAMRKAVVEQIEALKELSGIVEESGRLFDVSHPVAANGSMGVGGGSFSAVSDSFASRTRSAPRPIARPELTRGSSNGSNYGERSSAMAAETISREPVSPLGGAGSAFAPTQMQAVVSPLSAITAASGQAATVSAISIPELTPTSVTEIVEAAPTASQVDASLAVAASPAVGMPAYAESKNMPAASPIPGGGQTSSFASTQSKSSPPPVRNTSATSSRGGWVSDLLARASRDDLDKGGDAQQNTANGRQPEGNGETLASMSGEIVQGINHDSSVRLWQHYRRGQRNITADRLYTPEGLKTFEKIKHKYALDGEFRRAVSQYIADFERLLGDVSKNGGNNDTMREYLTSETGKVYTMLAHASGRIQ